MNTKPCVRCGRPIDRYARLCVYCNWHQSQAYAPAPAAAMAAPVYVPPPDNRARNKLLGIGGGVVAIILAFVIGTWIHGFEPKDTSVAAQQKEAQAAAPAGTPLRSNVTLVPATDAMPAPVLEQPVTSAPPQTPGQQASDATALPSDQYAAVAAKVKEQAKQAKAAAPVDPREVKGAPFEDTPKPATTEPAPEQTAENNAVPANAPMASSVAPAMSRTEAFPEYKPLPEIHVDRETSARMTLTVGADGRVKDIDIIDPIPGATSKLIQSVQNWRFKPATENGTPVSARVSVTVNFHANE